jgi:hypothetical protein
MFPALSGGFGCGCHEKDLMVVGNVVNSGEIVASVLSLLCE